jgi:hypothetical protein
MVTTLLFPSFFCCNKKKTKESNCSFATITFFTALQENKKKKATVALLPLPSSLSYNERKKEREKATITFFSSLQ